MHAAFPHWFDERSELVVATALPDIALALAYLAQEDSRGRT